MSDISYFGMSLGTLLLVLLPIAILEYGLMIWALVDILRRRYVRGNKKIIWILVIVLLSIIGPIVYFLVGRTDGPEEIEEG